MIIYDIVGWGVDIGVGAKVFKVVDFGVNMSKV